MNDKNECANCGAAGHPGHHWLDGVGYVCFNRDGGPDAAPPDDEDDE